MKRLPDEIVRFFRKQGFVIVSTIDGRGVPYEACKGIVKINRNLNVYLLDLYKGRTYRNLVNNSRMSITVVDEHLFKGYCLRGRGSIVKSEDIEPHILREWQDKITSRITRRIIKNIQGQKGHRCQPEAFLPKPEYMIVMNVQEVVNLAPRSKKYCRLVGEYLKK